MQLVSSKEEILNNLTKFENYFCEGSSEEQQYCNTLIQRGSCFIAYRIGHEIRFSPSRYIGYKDNSIQLHENNAKDGRVTNVAISKIFKNSPIHIEKLEIEYKKYCQKFNISPHNKIRKYWDFIDFRINTQQSIEIQSEFPEGALVERKHKSRERNSKLISEAKNQFRKNNAKMICQICAFDFEDKYGEIGKDYIEAHHTIPVSSMSSNHATKIEEIAMVCANCHRMLHRTRPWLAINELKNLLN